MQVNPHRLRYFSCDKQGHQNLPMGKVCIDRNCRSQELVCASCVELLHSGHEVIDFSRFIEKLDNLNFGRHDKPESDVSKSIRAMKKARVDYKERVAILHKALSETMAALEACLRYYDDAEKQLSQQLEKEPLQFRYNPSAELEQVNSDLRVAVASYLRMADRGGDQGKAAVAKMEDGTGKASQLLS